MPENKLLGPKFGAKFPLIRKALDVLDASEVAGKVAGGQSIIFELEGQKVEIQPEEILVSTQPNEGLAVAADKFITVAVDANITPELRSEGLAREVVRRIQAMRKNAGFNIEDRITTYFQAQGELVKVMTDWGDYVKAETFSNIWKNIIIPIKTIT